MAYFCELRYLHFLKSKLVARRSKITLLLFIHVNCFSIGLDNMLVYYIVTRVSERVAFT